LRKLEYVDRCMKSLRGVEPKCTGGKLCTPVEEMDLLLAEHYGQRAERYRAAAQGYVDDKLREVFPPIRGRTLEPACALFRRHHEELLVRVSQWSGLQEEEVRALLTKLEDRAEALELSYFRRQTTAKVLDVTALGTALAMDFAYTGRFTG
jgi:hypothetical protein